MLKLPLSLGFCLLFAQNVAAADWLQLSTVKAPQYLELPAVVEAVSQATVSAQTSGRIIELPFDVNDLVPQGAVVVRFTDTEQQARLHKAQGAMTEAQSRFDEQQKELARVKDIHGKGLVAKAALDLAQANYSAAKARLEQANAAVAEAKEQLEQTVVRAPYSGILQQRFVEIGELAVPGKALLRGLSLEHLRLVSQLPQSQLKAAQQSNNAELLLSDGTVLALGKPALRIAPQANSQSHSFLLRLELPKADYSQHLMLPGSWLRLRLQTAEQAQLQIPAAAVLWRGEVSSVWVKQAGEVLLQPVRLQPLHNNSYQLLSGLTAGAEIATDAKAQLAKQLQQSRSEP
ncbi:efflux RND transporter periplasmic adaptor subunit [Rheinheimera sp.]|uniref:efflux RND transporter periplasmic adaptor subunit n=1 Tax=Rheinheimera sp. TaxID=1869214 RepID=UPI0027BADCC0|nr:efflux RND transporter periplasmic adaptor subunit [Rheinheimera sp.]